MRIPGAMEVSTVRHPAVTIKKVYHFTIYIARANGDNSGSRQDKEALPVPGYHLIGQSAGFAGGNSVVLVSTVSILYFTAGDGSVG